MQIKYLVPEDRELVLINDMASFSKFVSPATELLGREKRSVGRHGAMKTCFTHEPEPIFKL